MVLRSIEMREIGFPVPGEKRKSIIRKLTELYRDEYEIVQEGEMVWVRGDLHNRYKRRKILFILSGGVIGQDI